MRPFAAVALWVLLLAGGLAQEPKPAPKEPFSEGWVLLPCPPPREKAADPSGGAPTALLDAYLEEGGLKVLKWDKEGIDPEAIRGAKALVFDSRSLEFISRLTSESMKAIEDAVKAATGLVALGSAAGALAAKAPLSRLAGARETPSRAPATVLALQVPDQSHPITQCVTNLWLRR